MYRNRSVVYCTHSCIIYTPSFYFKNLNDNFSKQFVNAYFDSCV